MAYVVDSEFAMDDERRHWLRTLQCLSLISVDRMDIVGSVEGDKFEVVDGLVR